MGWDARTTRINTAVTDADIQQALNKGLNPGFPQMYPASQFGMHVEVDRHQVKGLQDEVVYLAMGLSRRLSNGDYSLAEGYVTSMVLLPKGSSDSQQRQ